MKKILIILPILLASANSLAQDSDCIVQPTCSELGYSKSEEECSQQSMLRCPFDKKAVYCANNSNSAKQDWSHSINGFSHQENWTLTTLYEGGPVIVAVYRMPDDGCIYYNFRSTKYYVSLKSKDNLVELPLTDTSLYCAHKGDEFIFDSKGCAGYCTNNEKTWFETKTWLWSLYYIPYEK